MIGAGSIGQRHLKNLEHLGVERLVAYDPDPNRRAKIQAEHPKWKFCAALSEFAAEHPDAVIVASPSALHEDHTRLALDLGCAVFVEKPLSWRWGTVEELARMAIEKDIVTMVACNMRFHPGPAHIPNSSESECDRRIDFIPAALWQLLAELAALPGLPA